MQRLTQVIHSYPHWKQELRRYVKFYGYSIAVRELFRRYPNYKAPDGFPITRDELMAALTEAFGSETTPMYKKVHDEVKKHKVFFDAAIDPYSDPYRDDLHEVANKCGVTEYIVLEVLDAYSIRKC